jgi:hypothetical protein
VKRLRHDALLRRASADRTRSSPLDDAAARAAGWQRALLQKRVAQVRQLVSQAADKARGISGVAMKFDHLMRGHARILVQIVHILRDDISDLAAIHQARNSKMSFIRFGTYPAGRPGKCALPSLASRVFVVHECVEVDRFHAAPDAARATEIRNAGFSRHAGAGEDDGSRRTGKKCREAGDRRHGGVKRRAKNAWQVYSVS